MDGDKILDQVLVSIFKDPHSYTGENVVEISCHGSSYIQQEIIQLFLKMAVVWQTTVSLPCVRF